MASSKKSKKEKIEEEEEEEKKKKIKEQDWDGRIAELTKPGKQVGEKKSKSNSTRKANEPRSRKSNAKNSGNKKRSSQNGAVKEPEVFVIGSSSSDLEEHDEQGIEEVEKEQRQRTNGNSKSWKSMDGEIPKKRSRKEVEEDEEDGGDSQDDGGGETKAVKMFRFPMDRIRRIIKSEDPGSQIMRDAVFLVNKATEMFIEHFSEDAYRCSILDKKKVLHYKHLSSVVSAEKRYDFLSDFVPEKIKAEDALKQRNLAETGEA